MTERYFSWKLRVEPRAGVGILGGLAVLSLTQGEACRHIRPQTGGENRLQPKKFNHSLTRAVRGIDVTGRSLENSKFPFKNFILEALIKSSPDKSNLGERRFILAPSFRLQFIITSGFQGQNLDQQMHSQGQRENDTHACMLVSISSLSPWKDATHIQAGSSGLVQHN